jgi:chromosome segregation ATPase
MPFAITTPVTYASQEPEPIITISKEEADALKDQVAKLKKENEDLQFKCFSFQGEAKSFKRERDAKNEEIQGCKKRVKEAQEREEKYKDGLASSNLSIKALKEEIKGLKRSNDEMYATGNKAMIAQGDWRKKFEEKTQELKKVQQEFKKLKQEKELELLRKEKLHSQERRKDKESMQRYEESLAQITRAHEDQMIQVAEQIERLEKDLKYHKLVIEMSLQEMARWRIAFREMLLVSTSVLDEMPRMLRMAEAEVPFLNVSGAVKEFVCYCRAVVTAYKNVVKKAKKGL